MKNIPKPVAKTAFKALVMAVLTALLAFFINSSALLAQNAPDVKTMQVGSSQETGSQVIDPDIQAKGAKRVQFLQNIRDQLSVTQRDFVDATKNAGEVNDQLGQVQEQVLTLAEQLRNFDDQIATTESLIGNVKMQIADKGNRVTEIQNQMDLQKAAIENQKQMLSEYLNVLYEQENSVSNTVTNNDEINVVKMLLSDTPVAEQLQQIKYFNILEDTGHKIFDELERLLAQQDQSQQNLEAQKTKLSLLYANLADEKQNMDQQRLAKAGLLEQTRGQEDIYSQLLEETKQQQAQSQEDIKVLKDNIDFIQGKISELGDKFNPNDYSAMFSPGTANIVDYINSTKNDENGFSLRWPVSPSRGISAYFHDSTYFSVFGVQHQAIDIRAMQYSLVQAPADGVVYKVRDNGFGYSYLILAHPGGYMTVYGHVSEFRVKEGEKVVQGQVVALSGGMPGTKGAGGMTTGSHLHFEVIKGGKHVDPLDYLPLSLLPMEGLPDKYLSKITGEQQKISRVGNDGNTAHTDSEITQMIENNAKLEDLVNSQNQGSAAGSQTP